MNAGTQGKRARAEVRAALAGAIALALAAPIEALELSLPGNPAPIASLRDTPARYGVAIGPAAFNSPPPLLSLNGPRLRQSWKVPLSETTALDLLIHLTDQLEQQDHAVIFRCEARACGGFDFRTHRPVLPMPAMYVDLGGFQVLSAEGIGSLVEVLVSQSSTHAFAQITFIGQGAAQDPLQTEEGPDVTRQSSSNADRPMARPVLDAAPTPTTHGVFANGKYVLEGLAFTPGTATIAGDPSDALRTLAAHLKQDPKRRVALVGHSDWIGGYDGNRRLSQARAQAIANLLQRDFDVPSQQIVVQGIGFLSPRASNQSDAGREKNRRVEVVQLPDAAQ